MADEPTAPEEEPQPRYGLKTYAHVPERPNTLDVVGHGRFRTRLEAWNVVDRLLRDGVKIARVEFLDYEQDPADHLK